MPKATPFWDRVDKTPGHGPRGECWPWLGARNRKGYGRVSIGGKVRRVSRVVLEEKKGCPIALGKLACHSCDWPPCARPDHIFEGTPKENTADCIAKGRFVQPVRWKRDGFL